MSFEQAHSIDFDILIRYEFDTIPSLVSYAPWITWADSSKTSEELYGCIWLLTDCPKSSISNENLLIFYLAFQEWLGCVYLCTFSYNNNISVCQFLNGGLECFTNLLSYFNSHVATLYWLIFYSEVYLNSYCVLQFLRLDLDLFDRWLFRIFCFISCKIFSAYPSCLALWLFKFKIQLFIGMIKDFSCLRF